MKRPQTTSTYEEEIETLKLLRKGDRGAFERIFRLYWNELYKHAYSKLGDKQAAEEIIQDIFTTLWFKRGELLITSLKHYLHVSTKNRVINHIRSLTNQKKYWKFYSDNFSKQEESTLNNVYYEDLLNALNKVTDGLSEKAKTVFKLSRIEGYSIPEIAKKLSISEKSVEYYLTLSIKVVKAQLGKDLNF